MGPPQFGTTEGLPTKGRAKVRNRKDAEEKVPFLPFSLSVNSKTGRLTVAWARTRREKGGA